MTVTTAWCFMIFKHVLTNGESYFRIDKNTGVIYLDRPIDRDPGYKFKLRATATDQGETPTSSSIFLDILVVESNKKAPAFQTIPSSPIVLLENLSDFTYNIATLRAISNTDESALVFELVVGMTEQTNKLSTFRLESEGDTAHIRLARHMDYESIAEYILTIRIENKYNLAAETSINIQLKDVNDNIPAFTEVVSGSVLENEPPGTPVMQVRAIDADATPVHNRVTYELADNKDNFAIDRYSGDIRTLKIFDREEQDFYNVKVIATDNSPSALLPSGKHNEGQQVFRIEIVDKNDHPPKFTQSLYIAEAIPEDANINAAVMEVIALDDDTASPVTYSIVEGNEGDAFFIEQKTGKVRVKTKLDYETMTNYTLRVRAFDGVYEDYCRVEIKIENVNDNPPVFLPYKNNITQMEEELTSGCLVQLEAYDPDIPDRNQPQRIVYFVVKEDQRKLLTIDKQGCLSLIKPLDRDPPNGFDTWQVLIAAIDEDGSPSSLRQSTEVVITLKDINDNAPVLDVPQPVFWRENQSPGIIATLSAKDNDGPENGPPFTFAISSVASSDILSKFSVIDSKLKALVRFDREEKKFYMIPITITDSGEPTMTGTSTLQVVIGDENDNKMKEGYSSIFVYNYKGEAPDTEIGRVYVDDPDDWDLPDKHFVWSGGSHEFFDLNSAYWNDNNVSKERLDHLIYFTLM
uniref:Putative cadherin egf lag seven-pass g-type receptor n=1 Tax=Panstrongylus lignarius TaxID=156445 RepID=A0A224XKW2_9HEMI